MHTGTQGRILTATVLTLNCLLVVQYLLGMTINLFATIPFDTIAPHASSFWEKTGLGFAYAREAAFLPLQLHWLTASLLILASLVVLVTGVRSHRKVVWGLALVLFVIFAVATFSGAAFIGYAGNSYYSLSMATAFILASIVSVFLLFHVLTHRQAKELVK